MSSIEPCPFCGNIPAQVGPEKWKLVHAEDCYIARAMNNPHWIRSIPEKEHWNRRRHMDESKKNPLVMKAGDKLVIHHNLIMPKTPDRPSHMGDEWYVRRVEEMESVLQAVLRECHYCLTAESPEAKNCIVAKIVEVGEKAMRGDKP